MKQRGLTLIELLVAMTVSGLVIVLASRIFLSGHSQSLLRSRESELLKEKLMLGWELERRIRNDSLILPFTASLQTRYPHLDSLSFSSFMVDTNGVLLPVEDVSPSQFMTWRSVFSWGSTRQIGVGSSVL